MSTQRFRRWLKRLGIGMLVLSVLLVGCLIWLLNTNHGLQFILKQVPQISRFSQVEGTIKQFSIEGLVVRFPSGDAQIERVAAQWSILSLLRRQVKVDSFALSGITLTLEKSQQTSVYQPWRGIKLPVDIMLTDAMVEQFNVLYRNQDTSLFAFDRLSLSAIYRQNLLSIDSLVLAGAAGQRNNQFAVAGQIDLSAAPRGVVDLRHNAEWRVADKVMTTRGAISGVWRELKVTQQLTSPWQAELDATLTDALSHDIGFAATLTTAAIDQQVILQDGLELGAAKLITNGHFTPKDGLSGLQASITGGINGGSAEFSYWRLDAETYYANDVLQVRQLSVQERPITQERPTAQLPTSSLAESDANALKPISLSLTGHIDELQNFLANVSNLTSFDQRVGQVDLRGEAKALRWPLTASEPYFDSDARFSVVSDNDGYNVLATAEGSIQDTALSAELSARLSAARLDLSKLQLRSGASELTATGSIDSSLQLEWRLNSPDLGDLIIDARGTLVSDGRLSGERTAPTINARASGSELQLFGVSLQSMQLNIEAPLSQLAKPMTMQLSGENLSIKDTLLASRFDASVDGTGQAHRISVLAGLNRGAALTLSAQGGLEQEVWKGQLTKLSLADPVLDTWSLAEPVDLAVGQQASELSQACLVNQSQRLCAVLNKSQTAFTANGVIENLDLSNLNRFLTPFELTTSGVANGEFDYRLLEAQTAAQFSAQLLSNDSAVRWQTINDGVTETEALDIGLVEVRLEQAQQLQVTGELNFDVADQARWELIVDQPLGSLDFETAAINGEASLNIADLSVLPPSLLQDINLNGRLAAQLGLGGTIAKPNLSMTADIVDSVAKIPELGLSLEDINLTARSNSASAVELRGSLRSGSGSLTVNGALNLSDLKRPRIDLSIRGNDVQLINTPEMMATGDLEFTSKLIPELVDLKGTISIDTADLDFQLPNNAVLESSDVTLEGDEEQGATLKQRLDLAIDLGDNTHIQAQGLDAGLRGRLRVYQVPDGIVRGEGQIRIDEGRYNAYGQNLKIDQGRLVFNGGSIDDPTLDLRAQKTVDSITAGVEVSGRAGEPRLRLYSTPTMSDQDILSVLIFDKRIDQLESTDGLTLLRIASTLSGDGTGPIAKTTSKIQETFGLTDLELQLAGEAPSIQAGKQLSSKFYVGYGYGLLDATQSLILKYKLSDAWSIKADLGTDSGADLRYQVER